MSGHFADGTQLFPIVLLRHRSPGASQIPHRDAPAPRARCLPPRVGRKLAAPAQKLAAPAHKLAAPAHKLAAPARSVADGDRHLRARVHAAPGVVAPAAPKVRHV
eukprot:5573934-Prymnesium_polylepis.1